MDYSKYYEARDILVDIVKKDLLGPVEQDEILFGERPLDYYILGKLYPKNYGVGIPIQSSSEDCGEIDEESGVSLSNGNNPSSFGISFSVAKGTKSFFVDVSASQYLPLSESEKAIYSEESDINHWRKRKQLDISRVVINVSDLKVGKIIPYDLADNLVLKVLLHKIYDDGSMTVTASVVNENTAEKDFWLNSDLAFFQPSISISSDEHGIFLDVRRNVRLNTNQETAELEMLYSKVGCFASGHGCAANWQLDEDGIPCTVYTEFLPMYELKQMKPSARFTGDILQMKYLSTHTSDDIIAGLCGMADAYEEWIDRCESESSKLKDNHSFSRGENLKKCRATLNVLRASINALNDPTVFKAFSLANKAMFMQRKQMLTNKGKVTKDEDITWYTFQLAFFLQEIISFSDIKSPEHDNVDLLWFPTGGGKTEAYLGIAAFVIFLRRLRHGNQGNGVAVLMRYTLRLLTYQQFERASALICACEIIRQKENIPGERIDIGLWAGRALTPNDIGMAEKILSGEQDPDFPTSNPVQVLKCPWCGKELTAENYSCDLKNKRMTICCSDASCMFSNGLPISLVDEELYEHRPSFIVATIDKFAQLALNDKTYSLFGNVEGVLPPDLIIQDELHLISGPLGTVTGLYEVAVKKLCERNGIFPKVIASTATIKNAKEQINGLYATSYSQFPPQGISIDDSFFAEKSSREDKPARLYLGCMGIGTSPTTMMIRAQASLLYASRYLIDCGFDEKVIDSFWTITGYFNTLRELGGAIIRVVDDIQDRFSYLRAKKFSPVYPMKSEKKRYANYLELTSREKSDKIGEIIQNELTKSFKADNSSDPIDFLLSSNMISVGVDVGRLGSMVVVGQPKTTSEYIQATSRVGRETPGLVLTTYNQSKSRDRSHYEDFMQYHESFYKYVEATSVTPFSDRARDRALQSVFVILCRSMIPELRGDKCAAAFNKNHPTVENIKQYILNYVRKVDPDEYDNVRNDLNRIIDEWDDKTASGVEMKYRYNSFRKSDESLFDPDWKESSRFRVLNSMRSVETSVTVTVKE